VKLLEVTLLEEVAGVPCCVPPEAICTPEEVASFLLDGEDPGEGRLLLASRHGEFLHDDDLEAEEVRPTVHVQTVEEVKTVEKIPLRPVTDTTIGCGIHRAGSCPGRSGEERNYLPCYLRKWPGNCQSESK